jgi:hypothetical protein
MVSGIVNVSGMPLAAATKAGDTSVAAGGFYQFFACAEQSAFFGVCDHRRADTAFDGVGWIAAFHFHQHRCTCTGGDAVEANQWCASDGICVVQIKCHDGLSEVGCMDTTSQVMPRD